MKPYKFIDLILAVLLVGVFVPLVAYIKLCPHGLFDYVESVKFEYNLVVNSFGKEIKPVHFYLKKDFHEGSFVDYQATSLILKYLPSTSHAVVTVQDNLGGRSDLLEFVTKAIQQSKATIFMKLHRFGFSCGTYILNTGNYTILPNDSLILLHTGSLIYTDYDGTLKQIRIAPNTGIHVIELMYQQTIERFKSWLPYMSSEDLTRYLKGEDVYLTGKNICDKYGDSNPPVLFHYKTDAEEGCVLKGLKS